MTRELRLRDTHGTRIGVACEPDGPVPAEFLREIATRALDSPAQIDARAHELMLGWTAAEPR